MGGTRSSGGSGRAVASRSPSTGIDQERVKVTRRAVAAGVRPFDEKDRSQAVAPGGNAAAVLNSRPRVGYTVYGTTLSGSTEDGKTKEFAAVSYESGESRSSINSGARYLRRVGDKAFPLDDQNFKGILVSR